MPELLARRVAAGDRVIYCTNNSRWHRSQYRARLESMGAPVDAVSIVTAARATALALKERNPRLTMVLGGPGLAREVRDVDLKVVAPTPRGLAAGPDALLVGVDFSLDYRRLSIAASVARAGALFIATNRDPVFPLPDGVHAGAGAIVAAVCVASGREPGFPIGKPAPGLFLEACAIAGTDPRAAIVVGDSLHSDMVAAKAIGARRILMMTGVTTDAQLVAQPADDQPDAMARSATELESILVAWAPR